MESLFTTDAFDTLRLIKDIWSNSPDIKSLDILPFLYVSFLVNGTMQHICDYFHNCMWRSEYPSVIDFDSAHNNLTKYLSNLLKVQHLFQFSDPFGGTGRLFSYITSTKRILNLEIPDTNFDIQPNTFMSILYEYNDWLLEENFTPKLRKTFIAEYLIRIYCYCPINPVTPAENMNILKSTLQDVNTKFFRKIETYNFDKVPGLQNALYRLSLKCGKTLFRSDLSPDEYYEKFTYKILTSMPFFSQNIDLYIRLYKLSVLANILICIQSAPSKSDLQPLLGKLVSRLQMDVPEALSSISAMPFIWCIPSASELKPDFDFKYIPYDLCFPCDLLCYSQFFKILTTKPKPNSIPEKLMTLQTVLNY